MLVPRFVWLTGVTITVFSSVWIAVKPEWAVASSADLGDLVDTEAAKCRGLGTFRLSGGEVTEARWIKVMTDFATRIPGVQLPPAVLPFCRVLAMLTPTPDSRIVVDLWLPSAEQWNGKFRGVGNGGLGGAIPYNALVIGLTRGYATAATDTGHEGDIFSGAFALGHPNKIIDYGSRAVHLTAASAKALTAAYYGRASTFAYF